MNLPRADALTAANRDPLEVWFTPNRFACLAAGLVLACFPEVILGGQTFFFRDFGLFAYPLAHYHQTCFWRGEIPLWNPLNDCGLPYLAQWNTMTLYPPALFYLLLPLQWALGIFCLAHLFWGALGMYFLARDWTGKSLAAAVAGVAYGFNGLTLNSLMWTNNITALGWMPWVVWLVARAWREGGKWLLIAAMAGAMQVLSGAPEIILLTWLWLACLWLVEGRSAAAGTRVSGAHPGTRPWRPAKPGLGRLALMLMLVAALTAGQWLPFLDLLAYSQRGAAYSDASWSMPAWGWANFLLPLFDCFAWNFGVFFQHDQYWTSSYYVGIGVLWLALLAAWRIRERRVRLLAAGAGVSLFLAMGEQGLLYGWLRHSLPPLGLMRFPIKFLVLFVFCAPLLAAFGLARWPAVAAPKPRDREDSPSATAEQVGKHRTNFTWNREMAAAVCLLALLWGFLALLAWLATHYPRLPISEAHKMLVVKSAVSRAALLGLFGAGLLILGRARRARAILLAGLSLVGLVWLDGITHAPKQNPAVENWVYQPGLTAPAPLPQLGRSRLLSRPDTEYRVRSSFRTDPTQDYLSKRMGQFANCNLLDGIPKLNGFYSLHPRDLHVLLGEIYHSTNRISEGLADFLGVSLEPAPGRLFDWMVRTNYLPLATVGAQPLFASEAAILAALGSKDFDPRRVVYLPEKARSQVAAHPQADAQIQTTDLTAHRVTWDVGARVPVLVTVAQSYYPCWHAYVDGRPAPLWRANYAFQALEVPPGRHQVGVVYEDRRFHLGVWLAWSALAVCAWAWRARPAMAARTGSAAAQ